MLEANHSKRVTSFTLIVSLICLITSSARPQAGHTLNGVGPVNLSMGGASTANPIDISGASDPAGAQKRTALAVEHLMGRKPELRFQFIQENARFVQSDELDV